MMVKKKMAGKAKTHVMPDGMPMSDAAMKGMMGKPSVGYEGRPAPRKKKTRAAKKTPY